VKPSAFAKPLKKQPESEDAGCKSVSSGAAEVAGGESNQIGEAKSIAIRKFPAQASNSGVDFP
jgi:hypothetical protein